MLGLIERLILRLIEGLNEGEKDDIIEGLALGDID